VGLGVGLGAAAPDVVPTRSGGALPDSPEPSSEQPASVIEKTAAEAADTPASRVLRESHIVLIPPISDETP
jgi:hypothetical protein